MTTADDKVERTADKLQSIANDLAAKGGLKAKLAEPLADDAEFLRKMKPSLIKARAEGSAPTNQPTGSGTVAPSGPQLGERAGPKKPSGGGGPNPWIVVGIALAVGIVVAKWIDWRGHAHPRG